MLWINRPRVAIFYIVNNNKYSKDYEIQEDKTYTEKQKYLTNSK